MNAGQLGRWRARGEAARARLEEARARHASVEFGLTLIEGDSSIGGGLLAGALAYRIFVLLLPTALLLVSGLGLYADAVDKSTREVTREAGLHGPYVFVAHEVPRPARLTACGDHGVAVPNPLWTERIRSFHRAHRGPGDGALVLVRKLKNVLTERIPLLDAEHGPRF